MDTILPIFKALSDRNRLRIFAALMQYNELCACQIVELLQITGATASRHLTQLVHAGLLQSRKEGRWIYYCLKANKFNSEVAERWLKDRLSQSEFFNSDLKNLKKITVSDREDLCRKQRGEVCCPVKQ
ncbi:MAG: metalloregulator ArsR/SmtB family transcription factor [Pseudomonadota bacterium]